MAESALITIELCGKLADPCGPTISIPIPVSGCTAAALRAAAALHDPALADVLATTRVRVCINESVAGDDAPVAPGDRVALMPPVSGG